MRYACSQTLRTIRKGMQSPGNQHGLAVIARDDLPAYWLELSVTRGQLTRSDADMIWRHWKHGQWPDDPALQDRLEKILEAAVGNAANVKTAVGSGRLLKDFRGIGRHAITRYGGKEYIVFKGYAGLRSVFKGTRYLATNPKIVAMGIGRLGVHQAAKAGARLTIVLMAGYRVLEYLLKDKATLGNLIGRLSTDVLKIGAASLIGYGAATIGGVTSMGLVAGPLIVSLIFGVGAAFLLEFLDGRFGGTDKLVAQIEITLAGIGAANTWGCRLRASARDMLHDAVDETAQVLVDAARRFDDKTVRELIGPRFYRGGHHLPTLNW